LGQARLIQRARDLEHELLAPARDDRFLPGVGVVQNPTIDVLLQKVDEVDQDQTPVGLIARRQCLQCVGEGPRLDSHLPKAIDQRLDPLANGLPHEATARSAGAGHSTVAEVGVAVDVVKQPHSEHLGRLIELRENARHTDSVGHEWFTVGLVVRRVERAQQLVGPMYERQVLQREPALEQLVVQLDVRLGDRIQRTASIASASVTT